MVPYKYSFWNDMHLRKMIKMFYDIYRMTQDQVLAKYSQQPKSSLQFYGLQSKNDFYILEIVLNIWKERICNRDVCWPAKPQAVTVWFWEVASPSLDLQQMSYRCTSLQDETSVCLSEWKYFTHSLLGVIIGFVFKYLHDKNYFFISVLLPISFGNSLLRSA